MTEPHVKFQLVRSRDRFARLLQLAEEQRKALERDPKPFLDRAYRELSLIYHELNEVRHVLLGTDEMTADARELPLVCESPAATLRRRHEKALNILRSLSTKLHNPPSIP